MITKFTTGEHRFISCNGYSFNVEHTKFHIWGDVVMSKWHTVVYHNKPSDNFNFFII